MKGNKLFEILAEYYRGDNTKIIEQANDILCSILDENIKSRLGRELMEAIEGYCDKYDICPNCGIILLEHKMCPSCKYEK